MKSNFKALNFTHCRWVLILFFLITSEIFAQNHSETIQLLDQSTRDPIIGATYKYGTQTGITEVDGMITIHLTEGESLIISHVSYGQWLLEDPAVKSALKSGHILKSEEIVHMQPVTIIALRPQISDAREVTLSSEDRMSHDAGAILNQIPTINSIRKSGSYGFDPVLRGFKYDQLNIVINGAQCATAACPNRMDPPVSQVAPNMMDRIEILKGPYSLRFGNSFGGTINFISASPNFTIDKSMYGRLSGSYESNGDILRSEGLVGFRNKVYDLGLFGSWSQGNDYEDGEGVLFPSGFQRGSSGALLGLQVSKNQLLTLSGTYNFARDVDFPALPMDLRKDDTWLFNAKHEINLNGDRLKSWNTTLYYTRVDHLMDNFGKSLDPRMVNAETDASTNTFGGRSEGSWKLHSGTVFGGIDLRVENAEGIRSREFLMGPNMGNTVYDNVWQDARISRPGLFAEYQMHKNKLQMVFSGRLELSNASIDDPTNEFTNVNTDVEASQLNPSFSLGAISNLGKGITLGFWFGRAQRSGGLTELYINYFPVGLDPYEMLGNPQLIPEINNQADITFNFNNQKSDIKLDVFASFLQNYISSEIDTSLSPRMPSSPGVRQYKNIDEAFKTGFEVSWSQALPASLQHQMSVAYTYGQNLGNDEPLQEIAPLDLRYTLLGKYFKQKLLPEITFRYVMKQDRISTDFGETSSPGFSLVDLSANYTFSKMFNTKIGVRNLFDVAYYEHLSRSVKGNTRAIYAPGRNLFVTLTMDLM